MDTMAALFEAVGLTPSAAAPSAAANEAAGEPSPAAPPTNHAPARLSFGMPVAETPEAATTLAARDDPMSAVDMTTISMSPAAHSAEVRAALDMAAETARLHTIIKDLEYAAVVSERDKVVAAIISERDKVVAAQAAENSQLRRDMKHMQALHEQRTQYEHEATLMQSQLAATPAVPRTPDEPAVDGPATVKTAVTKFIIRQLVEKSPAGMAGQGAEGDKKNSGAGHWNMGPDSIYKFHRRNESSKPWRSRYTPRWKSLYKDWTLRLGCRRGTIYSNAASQLDHRRATLSRSSVRMAPESNLETKYAKEKVNTKFKGDISPSRAGAPMHADARDAQESYTQIYQNSGGGRTEITRDRVKRQQTDRSKNDNRTRAHRKKAPFWLKTTRLKLRPPTQLSLYPFSTLA